METDMLDLAVKDLQEHKSEWIHSSIREKIELLIETRNRLSEAAEQWVQISAEAKDIDPESPWIGEEWVHGPWALASNINALVETLEAVDRGEDPAYGKVRTRNNGLLAVQVWPHDFYDWVFVNDLKAEVWMRPGISRENLSDNIACFYKNSKAGGTVALVLGAGNVSSIAPLDALHKLYNDGQVAIVKMNPVLDYLGPLFMDVFAPFIDAGYLRVVYGGADVGQYLVHHPGVDTIHLTGSTDTYHAIVYGRGEEGRQRMDRSEPILKKPITSELGGVSPIIVVPGPWTQEDIKYQAENIVTMKLHTAGTLCIAGQILVTPENWEHSSDLLESVREVMRTTPDRTAYYPGAGGRLASVLAAHPEAEIYGDDSPKTLITDIDHKAENEYCFKEECFGAVLAHTNLPGDTPSEFLLNAVEFCNTMLNGALGATILIHPKTIKQIGPIYEQVLEDLKYGGIGVNIWSAAAYMIARGAWGGYQEESESEFHQSGFGFVHNALMFERPQKTLVYGSFYALPRAWRHGAFHLAPKPQWFISNKTADVTARRVTEYYLDPGSKHLPGIVLSALRG